MTVDGFWEQIGRWAITASGFIAIAFVSLLKFWASDRLGKVDKQLESHDEDITDHGKQLAAIDVHIKNAEKGREEQRESMQTLHEKVDRLIERAS